MLNRSFLACGLRKSEVESEKISQFDQRFGVLYF